jgi:hypothetical protein
MTNPHRFILEPYNGQKSRFICPKCEHRFKTFKRYIDTQTNQYLADHVGRCDREEKCGFHYTPREYFKANPYNNAKAFTPKQKKQPAPQTFSTMPFSLVTDSQRSYDHNYFMYFLGEMLGYATAEELAKQYHIGTAKHWQGATVFWQVDAKGRVRTGKIMLYNPDTCKRVKEPFNHITWVHKLVGSKQFAVGNKQLADSSRQFAGGKVKPANCTLPTANFSLRQCLFGEHLLAAEPNKPVAIAESEKTAIIASYCMPQFAWLAAGSLDGLNADKCSVLKGREVLLFPDVNNYHKWRDKARELNLRIPTAVFTVHEEMERTATNEERATGADMADRWIAEWMEMKNLTIKP